MSTILNILSYLAITATAYNMNKTNIHEKKIIKLQFEDIKKDLYKVGVNSDQDLVISLDLMYKIKYSNDNIDKLVKDEVSEYNYKNQ